MQKAYVDALLERTEEGAPGNIRSKNVIVLDTLPEGFTQGFTLNQWYEAKLTLEQRTFVDKPLERPVRLRGRAGTGKTLALLIKMLRDAHQAHLKQQKLDFAFIAHSGAAIELVTSILQSFAEWELCRTSPYVNIQVKTLYQLAVDLLVLEFHDLQLLDTDGFDGKQLQIMQIEELVRGNRDALISLFGRDMSDEFRARLADPKEEAVWLLAVELLNEFAVMLEPERIALGNRQGERYVTTPRSPSLMRLANKGDRLAVLHVHKFYRDALRAQNMLSLEEIIAQFANDLRQPVWDRLRGRQGFDVIFVDEGHLFNRVELGTLPNLLKLPEDQRKTTPIFISYDLRQALREHYAAGTVEAPGIANSYMGTQFKGSELVDLRSVFRYTEEIAEFVYDVASAYPTPEILDELDLSEQVAPASKGMKPIVCRFDTNTRLYNAVFREATRVAHLIGQGRRVAVICMDDALFAAYRDEYTTYKSKFIPVSASNDIQGLRYAGKRFVFSTPEYVLGLQFDVVFLINLDAKIYAANSSSVVSKSQFLRRVHIAATRSSKVLVICYSDQGGGIPAVLELARRRGTLEDRVSVALDPEALK